MEYFPIFMRLTARAVLVVGGGESAANKVALLLKTEARITVVSKTFSERLAELGTSDRVQLIERDFLRDDVNAQELVFVATDNPQLRELAADQAHQQRLPVNVVAHSFKFHHAFHR